MKSDESLRNLVALSLAEGIGPVGFKKLRERFGSLEAILKANPAFKETSLLESADLEIKKAERAGIQIISFFDSRYPAALKEIYNPPILFYMKGKLPPEAQPRVAIVGSRISSLYGQRMARDIARDLSEAGVVIVSGMALGIDSAAHEGTLTAEGVTLAVLGSGLCKIYPPDNKKLAEKIMENGALISEFPPDTEARPQYFPLRNRIISGLSLAVLVVEANEKSGALITAGLALEQGRDVLAVPGNADSQKSSGTNSLIKQGAKLVTCAGDILEELNLSPVKPKLAITQTLTQGEDKILSLLESEPLQVESILEESGLSAPETASLLSLLEVKGYVRELPGKFFAKK